MTPALPGPHAHEYRALEETAEALGLGPEHAFIAHRRADLQQPFMLFVMGSAASGKSSIINALAGRDVAPVGEGQPWVNVYRLARGRHEYAEVYRGGLFAEPVLMPIAEARTLGRRSGAGGGALRAAFRQDGMPEIDRIVWHLHAPGLPEHVALAEAPAHAVDHDAILWRADALLHALPVDRLDEPEVRAELEATVRRANPALPVMGVLTHMNAVDRGVWNSVLHEVRQTLQGAFVHVLPFVPPAEMAAEDFSTPLRRTVRNHFFRGAAQAREDSHARFLSAMRAFLAVRFETFVDATLTNRSRYLAFEGALRRRLERVCRERAGQARALLDQLASGRDAAAGRTEAGEIFFEEAQAALVDAGREALGALAFEAVPIARPRALGPGVSQRLLAPPDADTYGLPVPPRGVLQTLAHGPAPRRLGVQASPETPLRAELAEDTEAEIHPAPEAWWRQAVAAASKALATWLGRLRHTLERHLAERARAAFEAIHGFAPDDAPAALAQMERQYMKLRGRDVAVPQPHPPGAGLSPAVFLARLQEPGFVEQWNRALVGRFCETRLPQLRDRLVEEVDHTRDRLLDEWDQCREVLRAKMDEAWTERDNRMLLRRETSWPVRWATELMRGTLREPARRFRRPLGPSSSRARPGISLFIDEGGARFLRSRHAEGETETPDQFLTRRLRERLARKAEGLWNENRTIRTETPVRKKARAVIFGSAALLAAWAAPWLAYAGTGPWSLLGLGLLVAVQSGGTWRYVARLIAQAADATKAAQTEQIYRAMHRVLTERTDKLRRFVQRSVRDEAFLREVEEHLLQHQARPSPTYIGYGELMRRLYAMR